MKTIVFKYLVITIVLFLGINKLTVATHTVTPFPSQNWCTESYNTDTICVSFSINEANKKDFKKNQNNKTLILQLPEGFEFNTGSSVASVARSVGGDITSCSFVFDNPRQITVTISVLTWNVLDTIYFDDFEIFANEPGQSGALVRNGGTFRINNQTSNPTDPLGEMSSAEPMSFTASSGSHTNVSNVTAGSTDNEIIRISVTTDGSCNKLIINEFRLNTGSDPGCDDPQNDIVSARIYYTSSSPSFSTSQLFGEYNNSPGGSFAITGEQELHPGTVYFWLSYDISPDATQDNKIDGAVDSILISGTWINSISSPDPAGSRTINSITKYYSISDGNWSSGNTWSYDSHTGPSCNCHPDGEGYVNIAHNITLNSSTTVDYLVIKENGVLTSSNRTISITSSLLTEGSGYFALQRNLTVGSDMILTGSGPSSNIAKTDIARDLNVGTGTSLSLQNTMSVGGDLIIDGTINMDNDILTLDGSETVISNSGPGSITGTNKIILTGGNKTISAGTVVTIEQELEIDDSYTVTNYGSVILDNDLSASNSSSTWINAENSTLSTANNVLTTGILDASPEGNTVIYNKAGDQDIKNPQSSYYNLTLAESGTKSLTGNIDINGDLSITEACRFDITGSDHTVYLGGDWLNTGTDDDPFIERNGKVIFDGETQQQINSQNNETFNDLEIASGANVSVQSNTNITVNGTLTVNGSLTLRSDATTTAQLLDNGIINGSGSTTVERYVDMTTWHYISSPISDGNSNMITGEGQNFYYYDETGQQWVSVPANSSLTVMMGYDIYLPWNNVVEKFTGTPNTGPQSINVTNGGAGWNLVGNPYPSAIDWDASSGWTKTNINNATYIWNEDIQNYATYIDGVGTNGGSRYIAPCQGFWVNATGSNGTLGTNNDVRLFNSQEFREEKEVVNTLKFTVSNDTYNDETIIRFRQQASENFDPDYDALKKFTYDYIPQLYSYTPNDTDLAVTTLSDDQKYTVVPLKFKVDNPGTYSLLTEFTESFDQSATILLEDRKENSWTDLKQTDTYSFSYALNDDIHRFNVHFTIITTGDDENIAGNNSCNKPFIIYSYEKNIYIKNTDENNTNALLHVYDISGKIIKAYKLQNTTINTFPVNASSGIYLIKIFTDTDVINKKLFIH